MRDPSRLRAFAVADALAVLVYKHTRGFPADERFGLTSQVRRAAVSIPSNIVEGCARSTQDEYCRFLEIAYGSAAEVRYQLGLAQRLGYLAKTSMAELEPAVEETCRVLNGLIVALRRQHPQPTKSP